ncbi:MAG: rRNA adenine N-6-methyltransferase family protein, partial [Elusimicrobiota bacterium]|nr:rRNA adenine N-6-methyltransferase family protein [Elusimicrobiota bacterium]
APRPKKDRDVLDELGDLIAERVKKGRAKLEELIDEAKKNKSEDDDRGDFMGYFRVFLDDPAVAAVTPSSKYIVEKVVKAMNLAEAKVVVEYGAAQGVITRRILEKMRPDAKLVAVEFNQKLYEELVSTVKDPRLLAVHGDVREIDKILAKLGVEGPVDAVTSGVPFSYFSNRGRHELLLKTSEILRPGGRFVPYQVTTHLIPLLKDYFSDVDTQFEVRNIPPHFVFTAVK